MIAADWNRSRGDCGVGARGSIGVEGGFEDEDEDAEEEDPTRTRTSTRTRTRPHLQLAICYNKAPLAKYRRLPS